MDTEEKQQGNDIENPKIECKSRRSINKLLEILKEHFLKNYVLLEKFDNIGRESVLLRIYQTFRKAFLGNVLVNGQVINDGEDEDTTSEYEPFDTEKENYFNHELMNRFDQQLVSTTQLRKTGPHVVKSHMKKLIRPELMYMALVNIVPDNREPVSREIEVTTESVREHIETTLHHASSISEATKQSCEETLLKSRDLLKALKLYQKTKKSNTYRVMCETPPRTPFAMTGNQNTNITKCEISKKLLL